MIRVNYRYPWGEQAFDEGINWLLKHYPDAQIRAAGTAKYNTIREFANDPNPYKYRNYMWYDSDGCDGITIFFQDQRSALHFKLIWGCK